VGEQTGLRSRQRLDRRVQEPGLESPPSEVVLADATRQPGSPAARDDDRAASLVELLRDLAARLAAPHDEHPARRERLLVPVLVHVNLEQPGWQRRLGPGPMGSW